MNGLNKFQALTIIFICMFVFIVAAIYTNTKEAVSKKSNTNNKSVSSTQYSSENSNTNNINSSAAQDRERLYQLIDDVQDLRGKIDELLVNDGRDKDKDKDKVTCSIEGVYNNGNVEQLSSESSLQEVKDNGKQLILFCSFGN